MVYGRSIQGLSGSLNTVKTSCCELQESRQEKSGLCTCLLVLPVDQFQCVMIGSFHQQQLAAIVSWIDTQCEREVKELLDDVVVVN